MKFFLFLCSLSNFQICIAYDKLEQTFILSLVEHLRFGSCTIQDQSHGIIYYKWLMNNLFQEGVLFSYKNFNFSGANIDDITEKLYSPDDVRYSRLIVVNPEVFQLIFPPVRRTILEMSNQISKTTLTRPVWLTFWPKEYGEVQKMTSVPMDATAFVAILDNKSSSYTIDVTYSFSNWSYALNWGHWTEDLGVKQAPFQRRFLHEARLKCYHLNSEVFIHYASLLMPNQEITTSLADLFNFSYILRNGFEADAFDYDISEALTPSVTLSTLGPTLQISCYLFIKGFGEQPLTSYYIHPFDLGLWWALLGWMAIAMFTTAVIQYVIGPRRIDILIDSISSVYDTFCGQGSNRDDDHASLRWVKTATLITAGVVLPAYTAFIISFMTVRLPYIPFDDIHGMARDGHYVLSAQRASGPTTLLRMDESLKYITEKIMLPDAELPYDAVQAAEMICKNRHAFMSCANSMYSVPATCKIMRLKTPVLYTWSNILMKLNSPLRSQFKIALPKFREYGLTKRFQDLYAEKPDPQLPEEQAVEFELVVELFYIMGVGATLAYIFLLMEILWGIFRGRIKIKVPFIKKK